MPVITLPGTSSGYASGENAGNFVAKAADAAANFACSINANFPGAVIGNPLDSFRRGLYDSLCKDRPPGLPPPPTPQFEGGQCKCVTYKVTYTAVDPINGADQSGFVFATGPIGGIQRVDNGSGIVSDFLVEGVCNSSGEQTGSAIGNLLYNGSPGGKATITAIEKADGSADTCGNPDADYPYESYNPPPGYNSGGGTVTYNDGTDLTLPLVYAPISPQFSLNPRFNVDVGGVTFQFSMGGVSIELGDDDNPPDQPRNPFNDNADDFNRIERRFDDVNRRLDDITDLIGDGSGGGNNAPPPPEAPPPEDDDTLDEEPKEEDDPKEETGVERLKWVKIVLTKLPDKVQFGEGAPNCYFAGWIEFKSKGACFPREQINFATSLFLAPPGADGYAYTLTNGAQGYAVVYKAKETA